MQSRSRFQTSKFIRKAFIIWTIWVIFYGLVMYWQIGDMPLWAAFISSADYNYTFAFLSILIWKICKRIPFDKLNYLVFYSIHLILAVVFSVLWLLIFYGIWYLAEGDVIFELVGFRNIIGWQFLFGMVQYFLVAGIFYTLNYYQDLKQKEVEEAELIALTREAELKALKLQMNPHFLFNSLNSISALVTKDANLARNMIAKLSELLRMSLEVHEKIMIPLKEELDLVHTYLSIEQIRFGDKMSFKEEIDEKLLTVLFPAMLLQPLLENAVKHGIANSRKGGNIELSIKRKNNFLSGSVVNIANDPATKYNLPDSNSNGIALKNIRQRLDRIFNNNYELEIHKSEKNSFTVSFEIPIAEKNNEKN